MNDDDVVSGSAAFERFVDSFVEHPRRDGPDLGLLDALTTTERASAEQLLLDRIDTAAGAVAGLAHLRSQRAVEPLLAIMRRGSGSGSVHAAEALWKIREDPEALRTLCATLEHRPLLKQPMARGYAAAALAQIDRSDALVTLIGALDDRDSAVRGNALRGAAQHLGLDAEVAELRAGRITRSEFAAAARAALAAR